VNKVAPGAVSLQNGAGNQASLKVNFATMQTNFNALATGWLTGARAASPTTPVVDASTVTTASADAKATISTGLNSQAPSFGAAVQTAVENGQITGLNTTTLMGQTSFTLAAVNAQAPVVADTIQNELNLA
jgi:hypothetical protein